MLTVTAGSNWSHNAVNPRRSANSIVTRRRSGAKASATSVSRSTTSGGTKRSKWRCNCSSLASEASSSFSNWSLWRLPRSTRTAIPKKAMAPSATRTQASSIIQQHGEPDGPVRQRCHADGFQQRIGAQLGAEGAGLLLNGRGLVIHRVARPGKKAGFALRELEAAGSRPRRFRSPWDPGPFEQQLVPPGFAVGAAERARDHGKHQRLRLSAQQARLERAVERRLHDASAGRPASGASTTPKGPLPERRPVRGAFGGPGVVELLITASRARAASETVRWPCARTSVQAGTPTRC